MIGYTDFTDDEIRDLVKELGTQFRGDCYHVLHNNCNHFSDTLCKVYITWNKLDIILSQAKWNVLEHNK